MLTCLYSAVRRKETDPVLKFNNVLILVIFRAETSSI